MPSLLEEVEELSASLIAIEAASPKGQINRMNRMFDWLRNIHGDRVRKVFFRKPDHVAAGMGDLFNVVCDIGDPDAPEGLLLTGHGDGVPKHPDYTLVGRDPLKMTPHPTRKGAFYGWTLQDMAGPNAAMMVATKDLQLPSHRKVRLIINPKEEEDSEGTHDAIYEDREKGHESLIKGMTHGFTNEIGVNTQIDDDPFLVIGRPGRVDLSVKIKGESAHIGAADRRKYHRYLVPRLMKAHEGLTFLDFPAARPGSILPSTVMWSPRGRYDAVGLSLASEGWFDMDVLNSNHDITPEQHCAYVRDALFGILGDANFDVQLRQRLTPRTPAWEEDPASQFVQLALRIAREKTFQKDGRGKRMQARAGGATADEPIYASQGIKMVGFPPIGEGEHGPNELLDLGSLVEHISYIRELAAYPEWYDGRPPQQLAA